MKTGRGSWISRMVAVIVALVAWGGMGSAWAVNYSWEPGGDPNASGNWGTAANWNPSTDYPKTADDNVILTAPTMTGRSITVDVAVVVNDLQWPGATANTLKLDANLTVMGVSTNVNNAHTLNVNGQTLTLTGNSNAANTPRFSGSGRIVKQGTNTFLLGPAFEHPFNGEMIVSNGVAYLDQFAANLGNVTNLTVTSSEGVHGTFQIAVSGSLPEASVPQHLTISGPGYNNGGALRIWHHQAVVIRPLHRDITVASDASCFIEAGRIVEYTGTLGGSGTLTLFGGGHLKIMNGLATHDGMIVVTNATLTVGGLPSVTNITIRNGGVLNGSSNFFPNAEVVVDGGTWNQDAGYSIWTGGGNDNIWSTAANWVGAVVPDGIRGTFIPPTAVARTISIDSSAQIGELYWKGGGAGADKIELNDDFAVDSMNSGSGVTLDVKGRTLTVNGNNNSHANTPKFEGTGLIVKQGTGTFRLGPQHTHLFNGEMIVSNGVAWLGQFAANLGNVPNLTVTSSGGVHGTFQIDISSSLGWAAVPQHVTISGPGYNNGGALRFVPPQTGTLWVMGRPVTVASDARLFITAGTTNIQTGALDGSGVLTITGGGTYQPSNTWNYAVNGASANGIVVTNATLNITNATLSISGLNTATVREYVIVDHAAANGNLVGYFKQVNGLEGTAWQISTVGTTANPNAIVLVAPPAGTLIMIR